MIKGAKLSDECSATSVPIEADDVVRFNRHRDRVEYVIGGWSNMVKILSTWLLDDPHM